MDRDRADEEQVRLRPHRPNRHGAASHRVEVLPVRLYTPYWARVDKHNAYVDTLLKKLIQRYGPRGSFWKAHPELAKRPIRNWQIWNEPNNDIERYWDAPRGSRYAWPGGLFGPRLSRKGICTTKTLRAAIARSESNNGKRGLAVTP